MALIVEKENPPAGTNYKVGDNAELDAAIQSGQAAGITVGADGYYIKEDGGRIESAGGTTKLVDLSGATAEDMANIAKLAEAHFLAQTTGVSGAVLDAAKKAVGLDPSDNTQTQLYYDLLDEAGYNSGDPSQTFDKNGYTGSDPAIGILTERLKQKPTDQDLIDAGLDPAYHTVVNSNAANAFYVEQELAKKGLDYSSTNAIRASDRGFLGRGNDTIQSVRDSYDNLMLDVKGEGNFQTSEQQLDMLEWDLIKKKAKEETTPGGSGNNATGIITGGTATDSGTGGITGGFTQDPNTLGIPDSAVLPTFTGGVSQVSPGASGTYTVPAQTFESNIKNQVEDFKDRTTCQQEFYQPQTIQEKKAAGEDVSSYAMSQKLYRNPSTGHQLFIPFQGDQALQAIPAGYYEVNQQTGTMGTGAFNPITAGGNTFTGANTGGVIQGYSGEDGSVVSPNPNPIDPNQIYGDVSFTDPVTGQVITQTPAEYFQSLANKQAQATFNPATSVAMPGVSTMTEGTMPGTVLESTAGQAQSLAPGITGEQIAQVGDVVQAKGPGYPGLSANDYAEMALKVSTGVLQYDPRFDTNGDGTVTSADALAIARGEFTVVPTPGEAAVDIPGAAQVGLTTAAPGIATQLQGGTATNYQGMADAVAGANWDVNTGTFNMNGQTFTPDQFIAANNLNIGDYLTTTGGLQAVTSTGPTKTIDAAQQQRQKIDPVTGQPMFDANGQPIMESATSVSGVSAATGTSQTVADVAGIEGLPTRTLQTGPNGELITGTGVDQAAVGQAFGTGEVAAASVQDELAGLMAQFEGGDTPAWAAGSMRKASQMLAARGLGASSMAGQAVIQAAMEAALPIAQIDAGNKQQMALFKAEQRAKFLGMEFDQAFQAKVQNAARVSEIANMNFSAEQQIALENSRAANTMDLQNLSNKQALVMAEAAALSQMDMANLSNVQQAAVQNAQNFLQIDMANLSNSQSTALFKAQQVSNAMLSDAAQANASAQFNATSANQTNQFFSNLSAQVSQFNAAQQNAINQFNAEEANAVLEFNSALQNQREMFNAQNYLAVAQANAQWRQNINTSNTEAQNIANLTYAKEVNGLTQKSLDDYWQKERDIMSYAFAQSEGAADRALKVLLGEQDLQGIRERLEFKEDEAKSIFWSDLLFGDQGFSDIFKMGGA